MAGENTGLSYLSRRPFMFTARDLSAWGFSAFVLATLSAITVVYLVLALAYLAMAYQHKSLPAARPKSPEVYSAGISLPGSRQKSFLLKNRDAGTLLVVTGLARNNYPEARRGIKLRGKILSADGRILADRFVYAGNALSKKNLAGLPLAEIMVRLSNKNGPALSVPANGSVAFMMVFDNPPEGPYEFQIEAADSEPLAGTYGAADEK